MKLLNQGHVIMSKLRGVEMCQFLEEIGRVCYKSEEAITSLSYDKFLRMILKRGHESVLEHAGFTVRFVTDRGVTHEIVRHRIASYSQESTRYCNYAKSLTEEFACGTDAKVEAIFHNEDGSNISYIDPVDFELNEADLNLLKAIEDHYMHSIGELERTPQQARFFLPNGLKTEIVVTANVREWRHIFNLRTSRAAHPQMRALMTPVLDEVRGELPILFDSVWFDKGE